jgi:two-component system OmpR family sensor kinase
VNPAATVRRWPAAVRARLAGLPLRVRLVAAVTVIALLGLTAAGAATITELRSYLVGRVDGDLTQTGQALLHRPPDGDDFGSPGTPDGAAGPTVHGLPSSFVFLQYTKAGQEIDAYTSQLSAASLPALTTLSYATATARENTPFTVASQDGNGSWRVVCALDAYGRPVAVAESLDGVDSTVHRLLLLEVAIGVAVLAVMVAAGIVVVRRSLRPLSAVEGAAAAITAGDLSRRAPELPETTEVGRLAAAFNTMLGEIEAAFAQQAASERAATDTAARMRRFVGDASHELRTPLTSIRGFAELFRMGAASDDADVQRLMARIEAESTRMGGLVEDLLLLARLDEARPLAAAPVDLGAVAADVAAGAQLTAPDRSVTCTVSGRAVVTGDEARLRQVLLNLVGNALHHTAAGTPVDVVVTGPAGTDAGQAVGGAAGDVTVIVADHGAGIPPEHATHVFERFYRTDAARSRADGGSGLGLAIVAELVAAHRGTVTVGETPGGGATFTATLPGAP